jgi:hypothetical protein
MTIFIKDPATGQPSIPASAFVLGFVTILGKYAVAGMTFGAVKMSDMSGSDFSLAIAALGGIYSLHAFVQNKTDSSGGTNA